MIELVDPFLGVSLRWGQHHPVAQRRSWFQLDDRSSRKLGIPGSSDIWGAVPLKRVIIYYIYIYIYLYIYIYIHMICMYIYIINRGFSTGFNFPKERTLRVQTFWRYSLHSSWPDKSSMGRFKGKTETRNLCVFIILNKAIRIKDSFQCFQEIFTDGI